MGTDIERGIASIEAQIAEHESKIAQPESHIPEWSTVDPRQRNALFASKWPATSRVSESSWRYSEALVS